MGPLSSPRTRQAFPRSHGGAWKVAYADFVTAMMALFIVLWMMNSTQTGESFRHRILPRPAAAIPKNSAPARRAPAKGCRWTAATCRTFRSRSKRRCDRMPDFPDLRDHIHFSMTGEGLRIDLMETEQGLFFVTGSPNPTGQGEHLLQLLAAEIGKMPNSVVIEGHTDSRPYKDSADTGGYGNWELSTDRANAARRLFTPTDCVPQQVVEVRGFADQKLLAGSNPESARNRRISLVVKFDGQ